MANPPFNVDEVDAEKVKGDKPKRVSNANFRTAGLKGFRGEHKDHHLLAPGDIVIAVTDMTREAMIVAQAARIPRTVGEDAIYSMDLVKVVPKDTVDLA